MKPLAGTSTREVEHLQYVIPGRLPVRLDSGEELPLEPGDSVYIPAGHDAWVEGNEPFIGLDVIAGETYAKSIPEERRAV